MSALQLSPHPSAGQFGDKTEGGAGGGEGGSGGVGGGEEEEGEPGDWQVASRVKFSIETAREWRTNFHSTALQSIERLKGLGGMMMHPRWFFFPWVGWILLCWVGWMSLCVFRYVFCLVSLVYITEV